jgi:hypothetical protein
MSVAPMAVIEQPLVPFQIRVRIRMRPVRAALAVALLVMGALLTAQPLTYVVAFAR